MKNLVLSLLLLSASAVVLSQGVEGAKDYPLFPGVEGFTIYDYMVQNFTGYKFCNEEGEDIQIEGMLTFIYYECDDEVDPDKIIASIENKVKELGGKFYGDDPHRRWAEIHTDNRVIWTELYAEDFYYTLNIIEKGEILSEITSEGFASDLAANGKAVIHLNFDRGECVLKEECGKVIDMIAQALKNDQSVKILIEGFTDNIGRSDDNMRLSENRAVALANALIESGVDADRIESAGRGEENPVASNETVEGRALNNRIEITKK
jgi:outer membrane protein OmpA-like peptidoglycan-associated protein